MVNIVFKILCLGGLIWNISVYGAAAVTAPVTSFADSDWAAIPSPGTVTKDDIRSVLERPIEKEGRRWSLALFDFNREALDTVMEGGEYEIQTLRDDAIFAHENFSVDSQGYIQYLILLVSQTKFHDETEVDEDGDEVRFSVTACVPLVTKLTEEELRNPIINAIRLDRSFEEKSKLYQDNPTEFKKSIGATEVRNMLIFVLPEKHAEMAALVEKELAKTAEET